MSLTRFYTNFLLLFYNDIDLDYWTTRGRIGSNGESPRSAAGKGTENAIFNNLFYGKILKTLAWMLMKLPVLINRLQACHVISSIILFEQGRFIGA